MPDSIQIRKAKKSDESEVLQMWKEQQIWHRQLDPFYYPEVDDKLMVKMKKFFDKILKGRKMHLYIAFLDGEVAGFTVFQAGVDDYFDAVYDKYGEIDEIYVKKSFRNRRVGRALMLYVDNYFHKQGVQLMMLHSSIFNHTAHDFYKKVGYEIRSLKFTKKI